MRVLIVDDEEVICSGLKTLTEHLELEPITSVEMTTDPIEALSLIRTLTPEIVLTDIKMPSLSGLELMEQARSIAPASRFVVVSGHDDFALVRQALKQRATDYLLKPATTDELRGALTRTIAAIREQREQDQVPLALVAETIDRVARDEQPDSYRLEIMASSVRDLLPGPHVQLGILEAESDRVEPQPDRVFELVRRELHGAGVELIHVPITESMSCLLIAGVSESRIADAATRIARMTTSAVNGRAVLSLSSTSRSLELLPVLYREARTARARKMLESGTLIRYAGPSPTTSLPSGARTELDRLQSLLSRHDYEAAILWLDQLNDTSWLSVAYLERLRQLVNDYLDEPLPSVESFFSLGRFKQELITTIERVHDARVATSSGQHLASAGEAALIDEAKRFVLSDLAHHADLAAVAAHAGLSYTYFSTVFREHTGVPFSEFVREARMTEARRLLASHRMTISEVARRVGYQHPKHFSRAFKHYYGVTPRAYTIAARAGGRESGIG